jgi:abortive infection bacteriophage resistance protein
MADKKPFTIDEQISLLQSRGLQFKNKKTAIHTLQNVSYYRLKGYWWDMQADTINHEFKPNSRFEMVVDRYNFDRNLRMLLFDAIERIEIAVRTKMIQILSLKYGSKWYLNKELFEGTKLHPEYSLTRYQNTIEGLEKEFKRSQEIFIKDHKKRYPHQNPEAWKILEVATLGTLSKIYKNLKHQLPEKSLIANEMGLNLHSELSSWLECHTYYRNIIAHHSRLWNRNLVKQPILNLNNPKSNWLDFHTSQNSNLKSFAIISSMIYLCNQISPGHDIGLKIKSLLDQNKKLQLYKIGFHKDWEKHPIWKQIRIKA